jgi:tetratricopeptide (TPR) repeat protein
LLDFWPLCRMPATVRLFGRDLRIAPTTALNPAPTTPLSRLILEKVPLLVLSLLCCSITIWAQGNYVGVLPYPLWYRSANAVLSYLKYVHKALWPARLVVLYPFHPVLSLGKLALALVMIVGSSYQAIRQGRKYPYLFTGWFWFVGTLVPVIGLVQVGLQSIADRYTYVPLIGLFIIAAWGGYDVVVRYRLPPVLFAAIGGAALAICLPLTRMQVAYWRDSVTLFERALRFTSNNFTAEDALGVTFATEGKYALACQHFTEATRIWPQNADAHYNLAQALSHLGKTNEAVESYQAALRNNPKLAQARFWYAQELIKQEKWAEAAEQLKTLLQMAPDDGEAKDLLGLALMKLKEVGPAQ